MPAFLPSGWTRAPRFPEPEWNGQHIPSVVTVADHEVRFPPELAVKHTVRHYERSNTCQASGIPVPYGAPVRASNGRQRVDQPYAIGGQDAPGHPTDQALQLQQDEAHFIGADFDDRRGEKDEHGRPWYDSQYHNYATTRFGSVFQTCVQFPVILVGAIGVHYLLYVPWKVVALCFFYMWPPNWLVFSLERKMREQGQQSVHSVLRTFIALYRVAAALFLFFPFVVYSALFLSPFTYLFCRHEAATELFYSWFVLALHWRDGWTAATTQLLLSNRRYNPRLMPIRVFHPETYHLLRREWVETEEVLPGLSKYGDISTVDRFVNVFVLRGHMLSASGYMGFRGREWGFVSERFVQYMLIRQRCLWSAKAYHNWVIFVVNSHTCTLTSMRFASRFHPLTRNERFFIIWTRIALNTMFGAVLFFERHRPGGNEPSNALTIAFGATSFVVVLVLTKVAAATCLTGRGALGEFCQRTLSRFLLVSSWLFSTLIALVVTIVIFSQLRDDADLGRIDDPPVGGFFLNVLTNQITSEAVAWGLGTLLFMLATRKERKAVDAAGYADYNLRNVTHMYFTDFMSNFRWPQNIIQPPHPSKADMFVDDVVAKLTATPNVRAEV